MTKEQILKGLDDEIGDNIKEEKTCFVSIAKEVIEKLQKRIDFVNYNLVNPEAVFPSNIYNEVELADWDQLRRSAQCINDKAYKLAGLKRVVNLIGDDKNE